MNPKRLSDIQLIGISGKQFSGKDTLADLIIAHMSKQADFKKIPLARAIKIEYGKQQGLSLDEIEANKAQHRPGLIALGDWGRQQDPDYWLKQVLAEPGRKIISDVRLLREYELLRNQGALMIRLNADQATRQSRGHLMSETDRTETELDHLQTSQWDFVFTNNGSPEELDRLVRSAFGIE